MTPDELEFAISQYVDGTLPADETAALEALLATDAAARQLLAEYRSLDQVIVASAAPLPALDWAKVSAQISGAVDEGVEQLEFTASQYVDGTLPADEAAAFEARLAEEPLARQLVDDHRRVTALVRASSSFPKVNWPRLAEHLSDAVAEANEPRTIKLFAQPWIRAVGGLALAACVLIVTSLGLRSYLHPATGGAGGHKLAVDVGPGTPAVTPVATATRTPIVVEISGPEQAQGTAVAEVSIGAAPDSQFESSPAFAGDILSRSPRSLIATNGPAAQDTQPLALDTYGMPY